MQTNLISSIGEKEPESLSIDKYQLELQKKDELILEQQKTIEKLKADIESYKERISELLAASAKEAKQKALDSSGTPQYKTSQSRYWTAEEHERFLEAIKRFGEKDVKSIAAYVGTRNPTQVRTHAQKYFIRMEREKRKTDLEKHRQDGEEPIESVKKEEEVKIDGRTKAARKKSLNGGNSNKKRKVPTAIPVPGPSPPPIPRPAPIPLHVQQQIAAETRDSVLSQLKGWTSQDYNAFIEGLVAFADEKDPTARCRLISTHYLPKFTTEEIKQCFIVLSNVAKADGDEMDQEQPQQPQPQPQSQTQPQPIARRDSLPPFSKYEPTPNAFRYPFSYNRYQGYLPSRYPPYPPPEFVYGYSNPPGRTPFPPDPFSKVEVRNASEQYFDAPNAWSHPPHPVQVERDFPRPREQREAV